MAGLASVPSGAALGMVETIGLVAAIEAVDAMLKASDVQLVRQQRVVPGLITHLVVGETAAVRAAVDAGVAAAERVGKVAASHVIPRPSDDIWRRLFNVPVDGDAATPAKPEPAKREPAPKEPPSRRKAEAPPPDDETPNDETPNDETPDDEPADDETPAPRTGPPSDYTAMTVRTLRSLARGRDDMVLQGRAVASASKSDLVDALRGADEAAGEA